MLDARVHRALQLQGNWLDSASRLMSWLSVEHQFGYRRGRCKLLTSSSNLGLRQQLGANVSSLLPRVSLIFPQRRNTLFWPAKKVKGQALPQRKDAGGARSTYPGFEKKRANVPAGRTTQCPCSSFVGTSCLGNGVWSSSSTSWRAIRGFEPLVLIEGKWETTPLTTKSQTRGKQFKQESQRVRGNKNAPDEVSVARILLSGLRGEPAPSHARLELAPSGQEGHATLSDLPRIGPSKIKNHLPYREIL